MKFYSEKLNKIFDSAEACQQAEFKAKEEENRQKILAERKAAEEKERKEKAAAERKAMAAEVEDARKAMIEAQKKYRDKLEAFCKVYGTYHTSLTPSEVPSLFDIFNPFIFG
jgi:proteasome lid subunit RPN8/RPN11